MYVLGPSGEQMTEMTNSSGAWRWAHTNVYAPGLSATYDADPTERTEGQLYFALSDWLGTRRQQTDYAGNPCLNFTSLPYGDGLTPITISCLSPSEDATEHHFTGKERDAESGNDYFGARYYASTMGRFLSPDPLLNSGHPDDPQSWNRYAYVDNNPLKYTDPKGLYKWEQDCASDDQGCQGNRQRFRNALARLTKADADLEKGSTERKQLDKVLKRIGTEGKGDVKIDFGDAGQDKNGNPALGNTTGNTITINWNAESSSVGAYANSYGLQGGAATDFMNAYDAGLVGHEGGHLSNSGVGPLQFLNHLEGTALFSESSAYQGMNFTDRVYGLWNPSWAKIDQQNQIINRPEMENQRNTAIQQQLNGGPK